jgi:hypothetical protein
VLVVSQPSPLAFLVVPPHVLDTSNNKEIAFAAVFGRLSYHVPQEGVKSAFDFCLKTDKVKRRFVP